jgi:dihydroorotase-like cyclic amidohydrolase
MTISYDILLKGGLVVDPLNGRNGVFDIAVADGRVIRIDTDINPATAREYFNIENRIVFPGIIDLHVHASSWLGGKFSHKMMALAGVTTALDMAGPIDSVLDYAGKYGAGLNLACVQHVRPGQNVNGVDPQKEEIQSLLDESLSKGAIGLKILGGHYPMSPEATARTIEIASARGAYIAFHAGTLKEKSNISGFHEAIELAQGNSIHMAHINSYCRGHVKPHMLETEEAIKALKENPNVWSESYLSPMNGTSGKCTDGTPESKVTCQCLEAGGFDASEEGMKNAIVAGWAQVNLESGDKMILTSGEDAAAWWQQRQTDVTVSFSINPPEPRIRLVTAKDKEKKFVVDCISTDGGGIPRNVTVAMGLSLVRLQALSLEEFAIKTSLNPAKILGLINKGHLGIGADADISVLDLQTHGVDMTFSNGKIVNYKGKIFAEGTRFITTPAGRKYVEQKNLDAIVVDPVK